MLSRLSWFRLCGGASLLVLVAGCYGPGMYGPYPGYRYGYQGAPRYAPPTMLPQQYPGSYTVPGGVVLPGNGPAYDPSINSGGLGTAEDGWRPIELDNGNGLGDDGYGSGGSTDSTNRNNGSVPRPPADDRMFGTGYAPATRATTDQDMTASFKEPTSVESANTTYGFDSKSYQWVQGILSKENDGRWFITYSLKGDDEFGGDFSIVPDEKLAQFRNGDIVRLSGGVDSVQKDKLGKPMYRLDSIRKLVVSQ